MSLYCKPFRRTLEPAPALSTSLLSHVSTFVAHSASVYTPTILRAFPTVNSHLGHDEPIKARQRARLVVPKCGSAIKYLELTYTSFSQRRPIIIRISSRGLGGCYLGTALKNTWILPHQQMQTQIGRLTIFGHRPSSSNSRTRMDILFFHLPWAKVA